jgi:hypothetical protein
MRRRQVEISRANQGTALTQRGELSKKSKIVMLLAHLGVRRQAKLDTEDYLVFAKDLEAYEITDLEAAMKVLYSKPRAEGETAFPELAAIEEAVRSVIRARRPSPDQEREKREEEYRLKAIREMEEDKADPVAWQKQIDAAAEQLGIGRKKIIDTTPVIMSCPHCFGELPVAPNIRFWTISELRAYADVLERNQAIAAANREASLAAQEVGR